MTYGQHKDPVFRANLKSRIFNDVEQAVNLSDGLAYLHTSIKDIHLFSEKFSCPNCNIALPEIEPRMFSFNSPFGACEECKGLGTVIRINPKLVMNDKLTINEGGILPYSKVFFKDTWYARVFKRFLDEFDIDPNTPISMLPDEKRTLLLYGNDKTLEVRGRNRFGEHTSIHESYKGIIPELERRFSESESEYTRREIERFMNEEICTSCKGKRLKNEVLHIRIDGSSIFDACELSIDETLVFTQKLDSKLTDYEKEVSKLIRSEILHRLHFLVNVGLSYLSLNRTARTLSGGESQRIRLASQIGSGLSGVIYVLDEPSIGLHPRDVNALVTSLKRLRDVGNTIIVVEHDPETILSADHIVDFGEKAGKHGGKVVFHGDLESFKDASTITADYLFNRKTITKRDGKKLTNNVLMLKGASQFNLKNATITLPLGNLIGVTGVSGSGKSTLIVETLYKALKYYIEGSYHGSIGEFKQLDGYQYIDKVYLVDQSPIGRTPRSNPATYVKAFDIIRDIYAQTPDAKLKGYKKGRFSFNVKGGRCEKCEGAGSIKVEMQFLPDVYITCDICKGARYNSETLEVSYKGKSISDILNMTIEESIDFFAHHPQLMRKLHGLKDIGLAYIELGRPAPTLSGGEAQRVKLADELNKKETGRTIYILDEPTTGLHLYDVNMLLQALYKLVEKGNTVIVIEHNLDVIKNMDYIIDMGPEGGEGGGKIIFQGSPSEIVKQKNSYTGSYLKHHI